MKQTTELLERFVELAPKGWALSPIRYGSEVGIYVAEGEAITIAPTDDQTSAEAIIFLWDWLDGQGLDPVIGKSHDYQEPQDSWFVCIGCGVSFDENSNPTESLDGRVRLSAPTRIEALVRACVAVLEAKVPA